LRALNANDTEATIKQNTRLIYSSYFPIQKVENI
jgi:hypothetical protein